MRDNVSNDEQYLIYVFNNLMSQIGYNSLYKFNENGDNGYYIYKEDGNWLLIKKSHGVEISLSRYSNLYNLCLDIIKKMDRNGEICLNYFLANAIIPKDTEVLIFKRLKDGKLDNGGYLKGKIIGKKKMSNTVNNRTYLIQGEDNQHYTGSYFDTNEGYFFKTIEDYLANIISVIENNNKTISDLNKENNEYRLLLRDIIKNNSDFHKKRNK